MEDQEAFTLCGAIFSVPVNGPKGIQWVQNLFWCFPPIIGYDYFRTFLGTNCLEIVWGVHFAVHSKRAKATEDLYETCRRSNARSGMRFDKLYRRLEKSVRELQTRSAVSYFRNSAPT